MRIFTLLFGLLISQSAFSAWTGVYFNTSQQGLIVEINASNEYLLYIAQNNQSTNLELGTINTSDATRLTFNPVDSATGQATVTSAVISQDACGFTWGEAGEFRLSTEQCQAKSTPNMYPYYNGATDLVEIPQLGLPNANGQFDIYRVIFKLVGVSPISLQLVSATPINSPFNVLSAAFYPQQQFLYFPILAVLSPQQPVFPVYQLIFQVTSLEPFIVSQYQPIQHSAPTGNIADNYLDQNNTNYDPEIYKLISNFNNMTHQTSMTIINNIGGGNCYDNSTPGCF